MSKVNDGGPAFPSNRDMRYGGMTLRQYAAIKLRVPNSGADWLDEMIRTSLRDDLAAKAMHMVFEKTIHNWKQDGEEDLRINFEFIAESAYLMADAMFATRGEEK